MFLNSVLASLIGASMILVCATSVHAKSLPSADDDVDLRGAIIDITLIDDLRNSIRNIVKQTTQGLDFSDLQDDINALTEDATELQNALRESYAETIESYDEASALESLIRGTLRKAVQQNPDVASMVLGQGPASGSGSKLTLAIDMVELLEKQLEGMETIVVEKDTLEATDAVKTLFTLSEAVLNTAEWMDEAVTNFIEILELKDLERLEADHSETQKEQTRQKRSPSAYSLGGGWSLGGNGIRYGRGRWSVSAGPTFSGGKVGGRIGFRIRF